MKNSFLLIYLLCFTLLVNSQSVVLYEHANYAGQAKTYGVGQYVLNDFNDVASSIRVPAGMVAVIYEHATANSGYGVSVDLLEDRPDFTAFNFNDKTSYLVVFMAKRDNLYNYVRNAMVNGQFIPGHWERVRAKPVPVDPNPVAVVSPSIPGPAITAASVLAINGATTTITSLGVQSIEGKGLWERAMADQLGIIGNDYRGIEEIGSACFERASNNAAIPDFFNFWYPQKQKNDHRSVVYFKRTLAGKVKEARQVNIGGTFNDYDVNVDIIPNPKYMYLVNDAHPREYTSLMETQWKASGVIPLVEQTGMPNCDDPKTIEEFSRIEAEIAEDFWPKGDHTFGRARFADLALIRTGKDMCVYGTWIYDRGHCCHPEIHPAEQFWWSEPQATGKQYNLNVFCDASRRFFWRKQMDDGTKLKPWAAPPIKGLFAIAFEYILPKTDAALGYSTKKFEVANIKHYNVIEYPNADQTYNLVYQNKTLVSFIPHNNAFKVSFEHVGMVPGEPNKIRGFLVIETSVGSVTQIATSITVPVGNTFQVIKIPANATPEQVPQLYEDKFFKKEEGHYLFTIMETSVSKDRPVFNRQ